MAGTIRRGWGAGCDGCQFTRTTRAAAGVMGISGITESACRRAPRAERCGFRARRQARDSGDRSQHARGLSRPVLASRLNTRRASPWRRQSFRRVEGPGTSAPDEWESARDAIHQLVTRCGAARRTTLRPLQTATQAHRPLLFGETEAALSRRARQLGAEIFCCWHRLRLPASRRLGLPARRRDTCRFPRTRSLGKRG